MAPPAGGVCIDANGNIVDASRADAETGYAADGWVENGAPAAGRGARWRARLSKAFVRPCCCFPLSAFLPDNILNFPSGRHVVYSFRNQRWFTRPFLGAAISFWILLFLFFATISLLYRDDDWHGVAFRVCVLDAFVLTTVFHEFGHATTAFFGGDRSVARKGYLFLDFTRYSSLVWTILLPLISVLFGGIGLPGASVEIQDTLLRSPAWSTWVALAGPAVDFIAFLLFAFIGNVLPDASTTFLSAVACIAFLSLMTAVLNLIPFPPFDGWHAVSPCLRDDFVIKRLMREERAAQLLCIIGLVSGFLIMRVPFVVEVLFDVCDRAGVSFMYIDIGLDNLKLKIPS